jgi:hypothetical protein
MENLHMAKLKAHGTEVARFEQYLVEAGENGSRRVTVYSIRSDGAILKKLKVYFKAGTYRPAYWHDFGWKLAARPKVARPLGLLRDDLIARGYVQTSGESAHA